MIFAFIEDGSLLVHESAKVAMDYWSGLDILSGVVDFYDENGTYLEARFSKVPRTGVLRRLIGREERGAYDLVANPSADEDPFALALYETHTLMPNKWFADLTQLKLALSRKGVVVEFKSKEI